MMTGKMSWLDWLTGVLVIVGAINWGLVGAFDFDLVDWFFGLTSTLARLIYILIGLSGIYMIFKCGGKEGA